MPIDDLPPRDRSIGKPAPVTGGASGVGRAIAPLLLAADEWACMMAADRAVHGRGGRV